MLKIMDKEISQFYAQKFCLSRPKIDLFLLLQRITSKVQMNTQYAENITVKFRSSCKSG